MPDTTLIFSDENEMDMTASHTAVITRNLKNNQADKTEKIDITSFLARLNCNNEQAEMSKEFRFFSDPTNHSCPSFEQKEDATTGKKINFNEFLMSLKSNEKAHNPVEGPEKENVFFVPSQVSEDMARSSVEFVYSSEPLDTCNVTKVFRGQDDGMEMTKCQASDVKAMFSGLCEAPPEQLLCADVTEAFVDDGMDITTSHTAKMSFPFSSVGNQSVNSKKDFPSTDQKVVTSQAWGKKLLNASVSCTNDKMGMFSDHQTTDITKTHPAAFDVASITTVCEYENNHNQEKSVVFPSGENMDLTGNYTVMASDYNINAALSERKAIPGYLVQDGNKTMSLKKGVMMTNSQEQPARDVYYLVSDKKILTVTGLKHSPFAGNSKSSRQNFSPSRFIAEEFLPVCLEEMDSNESVSSELVENACNEINKKQISHNEKNEFEEAKTCNNTKRALEQDKEDLQSPKKVKRDENLEGEASQDLQVTFGAVSQSQVEVHEGEDPPNLPAKSPDCTHASTSSSSDSAKADTELTIQRSSQMESLLLTDSICEDNLREKFQSGVITVGEFLTLLQVHIPIQKPRHSHVPANCAVSTPPTPEDLLYSQYIYRPKLRIYEEDCQALSQMIDELKLYADVQDQLLVNVNKSLWEVMRTCSDEELKSFGAELNKMKSYFVKESKILAHNEKAALYSKLLQSAQEQHGKLQSRMEKLDELIKEAESCLVALEDDSDWEEWEADCSDEMAEGKSQGKEFKSLKAQEEDLQRELSDLEAENEQMLAQMKQLQEEEKSCQELLETYDFTEWEITEWSEQQAVFNFLYDAIELTIVFGPPLDGDDFGEDPSRQIVSLNFESLLDEEKAPPSSSLVQRLIFQFIESQGCWQEKCPTLYYLPQVLHDVSLVVSRCKILGEEIEFLERWGGKFNLLKTEVDDTKVKLLFSASAAFAKFELTLSLSADYPSASLPFTVQKQIGNIGEEEISAVLSSVPIGYHYLRRIVSLIHQNLLQAPR
ncbi:PREDICTED: protein CASC5 [Charadrius vociferus]|uniref:protein CASC5 n=1 Tax=Charadrius vociferus TaxID=50402 RepID=UPI00052126FF|nr:PREDICTED: protein CASC5 [Charadrius vociferus]